MTNTALQDLLTVHGGKNLAHVSEAPWSSYKESDYSIEQWHRACLIHQHDGVPTSKEQCKLPVKTPDGALNRNGVHAAAAALAGARGGVDASDEEKKTAAAALRRYYSQLDEEAPDSLSHANGASTDVCVCILPTALDPVRLVGDEEKHATLLFLGEMASLPANAKTELMTTLARVAAMTEQFGARVLEVTRLGEDNPPALVAKLNEEKLASIRQILLVNSSVQGYLSNAKQYPTYTPHVTLGYPDYTQEANLRDMMKGLRRVRFDRLALWWGDERIEYRLMLDDDEDEPMNKSAAWADEAKGILAHAVVEGDGGGSFDESRVKRDKGGRFSKQAGAGMSKQELLDMLDSAWLDKDTAPFLLAQILGAHPKELQGLLVELAQKNGVSTQEFESNDKYDKQAASALMNWVNSQTKEVVSPSGTRRLEAYIDRNGQVASRIVPYSGVNPHPEETARKIKDQRFINKVTRDAADNDDGFRFNPEATLDTSRMRDTSERTTRDLTENDDEKPFSFSRFFRHADVIDDFLAHFGIKGMKWGVRRTDAQLAKAAGRRKPKSTDNADTDGDGENDTRISADAERLIKTTRKEGHEMSDREMREAINRAKMVKEYDEIFSDKPKPNGPLKTKVEQLRLQKELREMEAEMRGPTASQRVKDFLGTAEEAYASYKNLDEMSGGKLSENLNKFMKGGRTTHSSSRTKIPKAKPVKERGNRRTTTGSTKRRKSAAEEIFDITSMGKSANRESAYEAYRRSRAEDGRSTSKALTPYEQYARSRREDGRAP